MINAQIYQNIKTKKKYRFCDCGNGFTFFACIGRVGAYLETEFVSQNIKEFKKN